MPSAPPGHALRAFPAHEAGARNLDRRHPWHEAHSQMGWALLSRYGKYANVNVTINDTASFPHTATPILNSEDWRAGGAQDDRGIILGWGSTPFNPGLFQMPDRFTMGNLEHELLYGSQTISPPDTFAPANRILFSRTVNNGHTEAQTVTTQGVYARFNGASFFAVYDLLGAPVNMEPLVPMMFQYLFTANL